MHAAAGEVGRPLQEIKVQEPISDEEMRAKADAPATPHQPALDLIAGGAQRSHVCGSFF